MRRVSLMFVVLAFGCGSKDPAAGGTENATGDSSSSGGGGTTGDVSATGNGPGDDQADDQADDTGNVTTMGAEDTASAEDDGDPTTTTGSGDDAPVDTGDPTATSGTVEGCGNGTVDPGEQCDGADLQGFDCAGLGMGEGTLACDPVTCTFDSSMCNGGGAGTSG